MPRKGQVMRPPEERFWSKVQPEPNSGCWLWTGAASKGYGTIRINGRMAKAYRWAYEQLRGPVPSGMHLDHLCRMPACVNPAHLEPVSLTTNILRGVGWGARNARVRHCPKGHPYDDTNTIIRRADGHRVCRACRNVILRGRYHRRMVRRRAMGATS